MAKKNKKQKDKVLVKLLLDDVLKYFQNAPTQMHNYKDVCAGIGATDPMDRIQVMEVLEALVANAQLNEPEPGKFRYTSMGSSFVDGIVQLTTGGAGYIISEESAEDVYVRENYLLNSLNGDKVRVHLFARRKGKKLEGEVVEILERSKTQFVGIVQMSAKFAFVVPDSTKMPIDIFVPLGELHGAKDGDKVLVKMMDWPEHAKNPFGSVMKVLGKPGDNNVEMHAIMLDFELPYEFPQDVEDAANQIPNDIPEKEIKKRRDFRGITTFTIDPVDAKDFDDALSIQKLENGNWEIGIHIADVSHYVKPGSILEDEAYKRATSLYLPDRVNPMLPENISNELCSLRPKEDKFTFSAIFEITAKAEVKKTTISKTVIHSNHRFSYEDVQEMIEGNASPQPSPKGEGEQYREEVMLLNGISQTLRAKRFAKGAINFSSKEVRFKLDEKGKPIGIVVKESKEAHQLIEELMLLANKAVKKCLSLPDVQFDSDKATWTKSSQPRALCPSCKKTLLLCSLFSQKHRSRWLK
jgi:ribonuclease R